MNRRERLMATCRAEPVDRPPACFYEITGFDENPDDPNPFNVYNDPSWKPVLDLAREKSDRIIRRGIPFHWTSPDPLAGLVSHESETRSDGSILSTMTIRAGRRTLTSRTVREPAVNTSWQVEHLLKDVDDFKAWIDLPAREFEGHIVTEGILETDKAIGDTGIVAIDTADPLCMIAPLFDMETYTIIASTETELFHKALEKVAEAHLKVTEAAARELPGRLWRICGPEYASVPYLRPALFREYVTTYVKPMVDSIQKYGGFARVHSHGRLDDVLDHIIETGCHAIDPIEPPPQGDISLAEVRRRMGDRVALFGNLESSDLENLQPGEFEQKIRTALDEGPNSEGTAFCLMPSACPYGRHIPPHVVRNYELMVELTEACA